MGSGKRDAMMRKNRLEEFLSRLLAMKSEYRVRNSRQVQNRIEKRFIVGGFIEEQPRLFGPLHIRIFRPGRLRKTRCPECRANNQTLPGPPPANPRTSAGP